MLQQLQQSPPIAEGPVVLKHVWVQHQGLKVTVPTRLQQHVPARLLLLASDQPAAAAAAVRTAATIPPSSTPRVSAAAAAAVGVLQQVWVEI